MTVFRMHPLSSSPASLTLKRVARRKRFRAAGPGLRLAAIDELPEEHRATFLLHDVEGLSNPEIAETLQIKLATVKSRVHRARLFLRTRLAGYVGGALELN